MSTTLLVLARNVAAELGYAYGATASDVSNTTTTITDTSEDSPFSPLDSSDLYKSAWVKIESDGVGTWDPVGDVRRISAYDSTNRKITVTPAFTAAPTGTARYGIYVAVPPDHYGLRKGLNEYINEMLRATYFRTYYLLTLIADGDCETSGVSDWTISNSSVSKVTAAANVLLGKQALRVQNSVASGYARTASMNVDPGVSYSIIADVRVASGTARLQLYDVTNSEEIDSRTSDVRNWRTIAFTTTTPDDCYQVQVRLVGDEATADVYWDNVSLRASHARRFDLPSWVASATCVEDVYEWGGGSGTAGSGADSGDYGTVDRYATPIYWFECLEDAGATHWRLEIDPEADPYRLLLIRALRPYSELSADTDTTDCDADLVKAGVLVRIGVDREDQKHLITRWGPTYQGLRRALVPSYQGRLKVRPY